ncbi:MAG TPA: hypothetical protein VGD72_04015 [Mycobacteriales bacterium]|jgi:hypothetical protein
MPTRPWTHEVTELAALFLTVGAAHLLATLLGHQQHGPLLLIGAGLVLVLLSAAVRVAVHVRRGAVPGGTSANVTGGLWRIRTTVRDAPGELAGLAAVLGRRGVNILGVQLYPLVDGVADEFVVEAPPWMGVRQLEAAVRTGHGADTEVTRAHVRDLADLPTRVLRLAGRVVSVPEALSEALADLCGPCSVVAMPAEPGQAPEHTGTTLRLPDGRGQVFVVARPMSPFTPAEYARARALVELAQRSDALPRVAGAGPGTGR